jgi:catechol 2,3-dioxygenase-like lactoylglutathione lyase family enzyme
MSTSHVGRLIDHIGLVAKDLPATKHFFVAVLGALGRTLEGGHDHGFWIDELYISSAQDDLSISGASHVHLAFQAEDRASVDAFHRAGLAAGGHDNGAPGERPYHPGYYGAFLIDPDGNNIEAVYHGPSTRSAPSVTITSSD